MREIKFRAWHKRYRMMFSFVEHCTWSDGSSAVTMVGNGLERDRPEGDIELMQYTGLKDENGKDGYAGDIVKMFRRSLFVIAWDDDYARFQLELVKGRELVKVHDMGMLQVSEIIGNIWENSDLLK